MADIWINILGDATKLKGALGEAGGQVGKFAEKIGKLGRTMTIVGGAITAAFGAIVLKTAKLGDTYDKMSKRTNIAVETLSALGYAAKISGADLDTVEKSLRYLARGMNDAAQGVGESLEAFKYLNIEVTGIEGNLRDTVDVLKEAATKLAAMTDETKQIALATEIFGARYGTQLLPMLKEGGKGIEALMEKAKELNIVISTESTKAAADFTDRLADLKESIAGTGRDIGDILIPPLTKLAEKAVEMVKKITAWADANKPLVEMIVKVGATLGVLAAVGGPILMAISAFMKMKVAITAISIAVKALAISSGPIGWLILAVSALALAWTTNFGGIRDFTLFVVDKIKEALGWLADKVLWVAEKLGIIEKRIEEVNPVMSELAIVTEEAGKKAEEATIGIDNFAGSIEGLGEVTEETEQIMDEFGNFLESFDDWVARLAKEEKDRQEEITKKLEEETEKRKSILEKFAEVQKSIADRIYELTHTVMEVSIKKLDEQKQAYIDLGMAIKEVDKWYSLEIEKLNEANAEKDKGIDKNVDLADSYKDLKKPIEEVAKATEEAGKIAERTSEKYHNLAESIGSIYEQLKRVTWERLHKIAGSQAGIIAGSAPGIIAGSNILIPSYQTGIRYVPETRLALVHRGEEIRPPGQRSYDQRKYSNIVHIHNPVVRNDDDIYKIERVVQNVLDKDSRERLRQGKEILLGA